MNNKWYSPKNKTLNSSKINVDKLVCEAVKSSLSLSLSNNW